MIKDGVFVENKVVIITGAEENNLKKINVKIPHNKITTVFGVSGSGKSSLIYSVLAQEAKRREKIDSGNASCLDFAVRPKFKTISNLPYCVTLKQRGLSQSISSTLATISGLHELLRDEFAKHGDIVASNGNIISPPSPFEIKQFIIKYYPNVKWDCFAIICFEKYTDGSAELEHLKSTGCKTAIFISSYDNIRREKKISSVKSLNNNYSHTILVPFDSVNSIESHTNIALESFLFESKSVSYNFSINYFDLATGTIYQKKSSELLSFNSSVSTGGRCSVCNGHGVVDGIDRNNLFSKIETLDSTFLNLKLNDKGCYKYILLCTDIVQKTLKKSGIDPGTNYFELKENDRQIINELVYPRILKHRGKPSIGKYVKSVICHSCNGTRLNYKANAVKLFGISISEILSYSVDDACDFFSDKPLHHKKTRVILSALKNATLGYLTLDRSTDTLSGGELQRLKFSLELNSAYKNLLYILDEPSTGLHPYNNYQIIQLINDLKEKNNTVIISEHNPEYIQNSDHVIELGSKSGIQGGEIIFEGRPVAGGASSPSVRRNVPTKVHNHVLKLDNVYANNIKGESFILPLYSLVCITGVSGSGKSSLIHKALVPSIKQYIEEKTYNTDLINNAVGFDKIQSIIELTQSQIGLNSRSIVATYLNIFDEIRDLFASLKVSREFNFDKSFFSFNSESGYCPSCKGLGVLDDMHCPSCLGDRYKPEVLNILYKDKNIVDVLNTSITELSSVFENKKLLLAFSTLNKLGLSHLTLGRTTPTLSGGEAQRLRLAQTLIESSEKISKGGFLFVLDEPTTGLNSENINQMISILDEIISYKNSVIIIEHNLNIIKHSDYIVDMGVGSGEEGGKNIFSGTFNELLKNTVSLTAKAFNGEFEKPARLAIDKQHLVTKTYNKQPPYKCNKFYMGDNHFLIEKRFSEHFNVKLDDNLFVYFRNKNNLFDFVKSLDNPIFSFNPFVGELYKFKIVPNSVRSKKIKHLKKLGFDMELMSNTHDWEFRVPTDDLEQAYIYGHGWLTVVTGDKNRYELSTRLVSVKNKIIGSPHIDEKTFNLYLNSCLYCKGTGYLSAYDRNIIIKNEALSINDSEFFHFDIKLKLKGVINQFIKEGLFDFNQPFIDLSQLEKDIFLFGFHEYKFLKPKGRKNAIGDYIRWQGLYAYIYREIDKIDMVFSSKIIASKYREKCPFCEKGICAEAGYYYVNDKNILEYL